MGVYGGVKRFQDFLSQTTLIVCTPPTSVSKRNLTFVLDTRCQSNPPPNGRIHRPVLKDEGSAKVSQAVIPFKLFLSVIHMHLMCSTSLMTVPLPPSLPTLSPNCSIFLIDTAA